MHSHLKIRNPNESPSSFMYISQTKHNHIATPMEGINRLSKSTIETSVKQKRQMGRSIMRKRKKRNRNFSYYDNDSEDSDESEEDEEITGHNNNYNHNRDRLDDTNDQPYPFWDTYDTLNQYYLEIGLYILSLSLIGFKMRRIFLFILR